MNKVLRISLFSIAALLPLRAQAQLLCTLGPAGMKDSWDAELRADAWAGCAIAKAELTPSRLQAVLLAMSNYPSAHHPPWSDRRPVITEGYNRCGGRILPPLAKETAAQAIAV